MGDGQDTHTLTWVPPARQTPPRNAPSRFSRSLARGDRHTRTGTHARGAMCHVRACLRRRRAYGAGVIAGILQPETWMIWRAA